MKRLVAANALYSATLLLMSGCGSMAPIDIGSDEEIGDGRETVKGRPPTAPSALKAVALSDSSVELSWKDRSKNETGFQIERRLGTSGDFEIVGSTSSNVVTFEDSDLEASTKYTYKVRAFNDAGLSAGVTDIVTTLEASIDPGPVCGDGVIEAPEICDGDCPASCDDGDACTSDALNGSAASCDAVCSHAAIADCPSSEPFAIDIGNLEVKINDGPWTAVAAGSTFPEIIPPYSHALWRRAVTNTGIEAIGRNYSTEGTALVPTAYGPASFSRPSPLAFEELTTPGLEGDTAELDPGETYNGEYLFPIVAQSGEFRFCHEIKKIYWEDVIAPDCVSINVNVGGQPYFGVEYGPLEVQATPESPWIAVEPGATVAFPNAPATGAYTPPQWRRTLKNVGTAPFGGLLNEPIEAAIRITTYSPDDSSSSGVGSWGFNRPDVPGDTHACDPGEDSGDLPLGSAYHVYTPGTYQACMSLVVGYSVWKFGFDVTAPDCISLNVETY